MSKKILVVGSSNTDMIIKVPRIPKPGETVLGGEFSTAAGGKGANQAVAAARAGGQVTFIARVGEDVFGEQAAKGLAADGIDVKYVIRDPSAPSGVALIYVDAFGENSIAVASGANAYLFPADVLAAEKAIATADILLVQLETPIATVQAAVEMAASHGVKVILNPAPAQHLRDELLQHLAFLTPNESETELLTGVKVASIQDAQVAAGVLLKRGVGNVIITLGAAGALVANNNAIRHIPGFKVDPVDTTAAGDVFNGALAVAIAEDMPVEKAVRFANAAAALAVTKPGAQPSAPHRQEIEVMIAEDEYY